MFRDAGVPLRLNQGQWGPPPGGPPGAPYGGGAGGFAPAPPPPPPPGGAPPPPKPVTGSPQTMAMYAATLDPSTGLPQGERPPASTAAMIALVCGILLCLGPLTGTPAVIAGYLGMAAAKKNPGDVGGGTLAMIGLGLGVLNLLGSLLVLIILAFSAL